MNKIRPFSCGSQFIDWQVRNCKNCKKFIETPASADEIQCEIDLALFMSSWDDGTISQEIADRMGYNNKEDYSWDCPELEKREN